MTDRNPHAIKVTAWRAHGCPGGRAIVELELDMPLEVGLNIDLFPGIEEAIGGYVTGRLKGRVRRVWEAIRA